MLLKGQVSSESICLDTKAGDDGSTRYNYYIRLTKASTKINPMQEDKIKVIITDDHRIFRRGMIQSLAPYTDIEIIAEAEHGLDLLEKLEYLKPDMITLGLKMPIMDGLVTLPKLKQKFPALKVIILTMYEDPTFVRRTIELGANAYFFKSAEPEEIYAGMLYLRNHWLYITELVVNSLHQSEGKYLKNGNQYLGVRELQILKLLSAGKSVKEIASETDLSEKTVLAIVSRIKEKAEVESLDELLKYAVEKNLI